MTCDLTRPSGLTTVTIETITYNLLDSFSGVRDTPEGGEYNYTALSLEGLRLLTDDQYEDRVSDFLSYIQVSTTTRRATLLSEATFDDPSCAETFGRWYYLSYFQYGIDQWVERLDEGSIIAVDKTDSSPTLYFNADRDEKVKIVKSSGGTDFIAADSYYLTIYRRKKLTDNDWDFSNSVISYRPYDGEEYECNFSVYDYLFVVGRIFTS